MTNVVPKRFRKPVDRMPTDLGSSARFADRYAARERSRKLARDMGALALVSFTAGACAGLVWAPYLERIDGAGELVTHEWTGAPPEPGCVAAAAWADGTALELCVREIDGMADSVEATLSVGDGADRIVADRLVWSSWCGFEPPLYGDDC